jgi:hypothetical protein
MDYSSVTGDRETEIFRLILRRFLSSYNGMGQENYHLAISFYPNFINKFYFKV